MDKKVALVEIVKHSFPIMASVGAPNRNGRLYTRPVVEQMIEQFSKRSGGEGRVFVYGNREACGQPIAPKEGEVKALELVDNTLMAVVTLSEEALAKLESRIHVLRTDSIGLIEEMGDGVVKVTECTLGSVFLCRARDGA